VARVPLPALRANVFQRRLTAGYSEVLLQIDAAEGEIPDSWLCGDRDRVRDTLCTLDRADQWLARGSVGDPPNVVHRFNLGYADAVCNGGDRAQIIFCERRSGGVDSYPGGTVPQSAGNAVPRGRLVFGWDRVLEIEYHCVGARIEDLPEQFLAVPGSEQITAIH
jgi:hypothetical protein